MEITYNLLTEPWVPCVDPQNNETSLSLLDVIAQAHAIKEIRASFPIITGALYLFLLAFVKNILAPETDEDWVRLWDQKQFSPAVFEHYAEKWKPRFDLFDPHHPFYQDPRIGQRDQDLKKLGKGKTPEPKLLSGLLMHLATGNNATLFDHSFDDRPVSYSLAEAAQLLLMIQAYSLCGTSVASISVDKYYKDAPFSRGILFINKGENLFETLLLNTTIEEFPALGHPHDDKPAWESDDPYYSERHSPIGMVDFLTWQSRRLKLLPDLRGNSIKISEVFSAPGHEMLVENLFFHNKLDTDGKKQVTKPLRFGRARSLWRDSGAFLGKTAQNALAIKWFSYLKSFKITDLDEIRLDLIGMCTERPPMKKVYFYAQETFYAPAVYLENKDLHSQLENGLKLAEDVRSNLETAIKELARFTIAPLHDQEDAAPHSKKESKKESKKKFKKEVDALITHWNAEHLYWSMLEGPFYVLLDTLPGSDGAFELWGDAIKKAARTALETTANLVDANPAGFKARAKAGRSLNYELHKTFNP